MSFNLKFNYLILATLFINLLLLNGCSTDEVDVVRAPPNEDLIIQREREIRENYGDSEDDTIIGDIFGNITDSFSNKGTNNSGIAVNSFLWRASLDTLSFMPLVSADPFGGVIITDWYSTSEKSKEKFKVVAYILDKDLRVDSLKVSVFKKLKDENDEWVDSKPSSILQNKVEDAILTKARKYKIQTIQ